MASNQRLSQHKEHRSQILRRIRKYRPWTREAFKKGQSFTSVPVAVGANCVRLRAFTERPYGIVFFGRENMLYERCPDKRAGLRSLSQEYPLLFDGLYRLFFC